MPSGIGRSDNSATVSELKPWQQLGVELKWEKWMQDIIPGSGENRIWAGFILKDCLKGKKEADFSQCKLTSVPPDIPKNVTYINLSKCQFGEFPDELLNRSSEVVIDVSENWFSTDEKSRVKALKEASGYNGPIILLDKDEKNLYEFIQDVNAVNANYYSAYSSLSRKDFS